MPLHRCCPACNNDTKPVCEHRRQAQELKNREQKRQRLLQSKTASKKPIQFKPKQFKPKPKKMTKKEIRAYVGEFDLDVGVDVKVTRGHVKGEGPRMSALAFSFCIYHPTRTTSFHHHELHEPPPSCPLAARTKSGPSSSTVTPSTRRCGSNVTRFSPASKH